MRIQTIASRLRPLTMPSMSPAASLFRSRYFSTTPVFFAEGEDDSSSPRRPSSPRTPRKPSSSPSSSNDPSSRAEANNPAMNTTFGRAVGNSAPVEDANTDAAKPVIAPTGPMRPPYASPALGEAFVRKTWDIPTLQSAAPVMHDKKNPVKKLVLRYAWTVTFSRRNTHFVLSSLYMDTGNLYFFPAEDVKISMSTGYVGFKNSQQGSIEAMYRLTIAFVRKAVEMGYTDHEWDLRLRGFAQQRQPFLKLFEGRETQAVRNKITRVMDVTKMRVGGVRPKKARRI